MWILVCLSRAEIKLHLVNISMLLQTYRRINALIQRLQHHLIAYFWQLVKILFSFTFVVSSTYL